ncbi:MAG TPA: LysM peptidoglycan-binding domain-containing protein [Anaerolineales bacterium]|nr:LysM peptidoglycan-binding domain-containing protein [Anaerolineales bacterium]
MGNAGRGNPACPYLGLDDDADTSLAFPSGWNTCHRGRRAVSPSLEYQSEYCLGENHQKCAVFLSERGTLPLQHHLRANHNRTGKSGRGYWGLAFLLIGILALVGLGWFFLRSSQSRPTVTEPPLFTNTALMPPTNTPTSAFTHTPAFTMTAAQSPISNGAAVSKRQLDQPIGSDYKFVIHKVLYGENLGQYASWYNTSVEAILAVSYDLKTPIWVDAVVIIPVGFTNTYGLPAFEAYEVPRADMSLNVLALSFGVSLKDLRYYNAIDMDESLQAGDWLLIPRLKLAP